MSTAQKIIASTSGVGGEGAYVEDVYSTFVYTGNSSALTITNNIDLDGEGGLVWLKNRDQSVNHALFDTERGVGKGLETSTSAAQTTAASGKDLGAFNSNGFTLNTNYSQNVNTSGDAYVSWAFRKAPKFFDVVTYTGNSTARSIAHNLGSVPGMIIIKQLNTTRNWEVYHRSLAIETGDYPYILQLNRDVAQIGNQTFFKSGITSTEFKIAHYNAVNQSGGSYVAYLFAHNDGDGEFGSASDQDIIKCGNYTGNGSSSGPEINLGFEPQWLMIKSATESENWHIWDNIRGVTTGGTDFVLYPNIAANETTSVNWLDFTSTGFQLSVSYNQVNKNSAKYVYIAIRRGPMKAPENATDVFAIDTFTGSIPNFISGFVTDLAFARVVNSSQDWNWGSRITGTDLLQSNKTDAALTDSNKTWDFMNGYNKASGGADSNQVGWMFRRSPEFFDIVAYTGDGTTAQTITHNLNGVPKMIWGKRRDSSGNWMVYYGSTLYAVFLNSDTNFTGISPFQNIPHNYQPLSSDSQFAVGLASGGNADKSMNTSGAEYILYIFGEQTGISKIGTYSGTGSNVDVDCGFSSGARFVMIKNVTGGVSGDWNVMDTTRGIDDYMKFNSTDAEANADLIDIINSGFRVKTGGGSETNASGNTYFFYAIA